jgi:cell division protein FtsW
MIGALPRLITSRSRRTLIGEWWRSVDQVTLSILVCLLGAGLILSMASSPAAAARLDYDNAFYFLYKHMIFVGMGVFGMFVVSLFDAVNARRIAVVTLIGSVLIMLNLPSPPSLCLRRGCSRSVTATPMCLLLRLCSSPMPP